MSGQLLATPLKCYRIGDPDGAFPIFSADGARLADGRWHTAAHPVIYTSAHYSTAMLEKLVHASGVLPRNQHYVEALIPPGVSYESFDPMTIDGWHRPFNAQTRAYGSQWAQEVRSLLLFVPSAVAPIEDNILINPAHPDFHRITVERHKPVWWDQRLYG